MFLDALPELKGRTESEREKERKTLFFSPAIVQEAEMRCKREIMPHLISR